MKKENTDNCELLDRLNTYDWCPGFIGGYTYNKAISFIPYAKRQGMTVKLFGEWVYETFIGLRSRDYIETDQVYRDELREFNTYWSK